MTMKEKMNNKFLETLKEVEGLVLAFVGFMILWVFSVFGITFPFILNVAIVTMIVLAAMIWWWYSKRRGSK